MRTLAISSLKKRPKPLHTGPILSFNLNKLYRNCIHSLTRAIYHPYYVGFEHIPKKGPAILISNHVSYMDGPLIDLGCNRPVRYLIDHDIYNLPGVHYLMRRNRSIPISYNRKGVEKAFDDISAALKAGDLVCIFPEGFLTFNGGLGRFRPGIEWITKRDADVPVIPMAISGMWGSVFSRKYKGLSRFLPHPWRREVTLVCGPAIPSEKVNVNYLQEVVLRLKYSINSQ